MNATHVGELREMRPRRNAEAEWEPWKCQVGEMKQDELGRDPYDWQENRYGPSCQTPRGEQDGGCEREPRCQPNERGDIADAGKPGEYGERHGDPVQVRPVPQDAEPQAYARRAAKGAGGIIGGTRDADREWDEADERGNEQLQRRKGQRKKERGCRGRDYFGFRGPEGSHSLISLPSSADL